MDKMYENEKNGFALGSGRKLKIVYICSPYAHRPDGEKASVEEIEANVGMAKVFAKDAADKGRAPFVPHLLYPQFMDEESEREKAQAFGRAMLARCDEIWVYGKGITPGMREEISYARDCGLRVRRFDS